MEIWKEYLAALGGTATALAIVKFLSETLLKQYLKKDEIRFENKLDALASKEETKYSYLHPKRVDAAVEIYEQCRKLAIALDLYITAAKITDKLSDSAEVNAERHKNRQEVDKLLSSTTESVTKSRLYFSKETSDVVASLINYAWKLSALSREREKQSLVEIEASIRQKFETVESHFKELVGTTANPK